MGKGKYSRQRGIAGKILIFLVSAIAIIATSSSLIFFNVPSYVYSNMVGLFIFSLYFGTAQSLVFVCIMQIIMMKTGLATEFLSYSFVLWVTNVLIIKIAQGGIPKRIAKNRNYNLIAVIVASVVLMAILSKPVSVAAFNWIQGGGRSFEGFINKEFIIEQLKIFGLSGIVTFIFYKIFNRFDV